MKEIDRFLLAAQGDTTHEAPIGEQLKRHVLVDHAGAPELMGELRRRPSLVWTSLFAHSKEASALEVAPILIELTGASSTAFERSFLTWLYRTCQFSTSVTILHSVWTHDRLVAALTARLDVMLPDQMQVMLRYFDTRSLEALVRVLKPEQREQFFGIASHWWWVDRAGVLQGLTADQCIADAWPRSFEIDAAQQNAFIEAGEADALAALMTTHAPDLCHHEQRAKLHALAAECIPKLRHLGIEDVRTQTLYCLAALQLGAEFDSQPEWREVLSRVTRKQLSFEDALREMEV